MKRFSPASSRTRSRALLATRDRAAAGLSLIEVMIGVTILGIIAAAFSQYFTRIFQSQRHAELSADRLAIRDMLNSMVDCPASIAALSPSTPTSCVDGTVIELKKQGGGVLVSDVNTVGGATKTGVWTLRAICNNSANAEPGFHVAVARPNNASPLGSGGPFYNDPMTSQSLNWSHPKADLFKGGTALCQAYFTNTTCPATGSALSGGITASPSDPAQNTTALNNIFGVLINTNSQGRLCRYYAPLVRGGNSGYVKNPPASWSVLSSGGIVPQHYGNRISCPAGWFAAAGGGSCDFASKDPCNSSGGFVTGNWGDTAGHWDFQCMIFWKAGCQDESIDLGTFVDCQEH